MDDCPTDTESPPRLPLRAAAICFRGGANGVQFLLVRTKSRRTWTFPKGKIKPGESPGEAASREAREEAGVTGCVAGGPLTRYRYPAWGPLQTPQEVCVEAYLMEVLPDSPPGTHENHRSPTWYGPHEALARLREGREPRYGREHDRLIAAALEQLGL
ncbi:MAG: NUDIX hydrolase [Actinomycetota bacterium]